MDNTKQELTFTISRDEFNKELYNSSLHKDFKSITDDEIKYVDILKHYFSHVLSHIIIKDIKNRREIQEQMKMYIL